VVTAIIPCFNHGRFVGDCIRSLERQTLREWHAILVDDASTDGETPALCDAVASDRVTVVHSPKNLGRADVRNLAITRAHTEALVNVDADDELEPEYLARTVPLLYDDEGCGIVYTDYRFFGDQDRIMHGRPFAAARLYVEQYVYAGSVYRKSAFAKTPGYRLAMGNEDWDIWLSIVEAGYRGRHVAEPLYRQRKHDAQWSAQPMRELADQVLRSRVLLAEMHAEGFARSGQMARFMYDTWIDDAAYRLRAGDSRRARESLRRAMRVSPRPWTLRPLRLLARSYGLPVRE
jgi:glycosyltransferase involved in cell wall biosynthesis